MKNFHSYDYKPSLSKEEKIEILKTIDRYENFGKIFKQDVRLLQENGLMDQKVKENVLLTKEFYDGVEIDRLFGTIETTTDIIGFCSLMFRIGRSKFLTAER